MGRPKNVEKAETPEIIKVKFLKMWSADIGLFIAGTVAELPGEIAESLIIEDVAEEVK